MRLEKKNVETQFIRESFKHLLEILLGLDIPGNFLALVHDDWLLMSVDFEG